MKRLIKNILPFFLINLYQWSKLSKEEKAQEEELKRIQKLPRYQEGYSSVFNSADKIKYTDSASFVFIFKEIFKNEIYKFKTINSSPVIIDAGANIGLSVIYFKKLFPNSIITAFEPDPNASSALKYNLEVLGIKNVELVCKALWNEDTELRFASDGADAGKVELNETETAKAITVKTALLSDYLRNKTIDFLKIDIEGAELVVLEEAKAYLKNVKHIFVEYHSYKDKKQNISNLFNILEAEGFRINVHPSGVFSPSPFDKINSYNGMDLQLNIFGIRE